MSATAPSAAAARSGSAGRLRSATLTGAAAIRVGPAIIARVSGRPALPRRAAASAAASSSSELLGRRSRTARALILGPGSAAAARSPALAPPLAPAPPPNSVCPAPSGMPARSACRAIGASAAFGADRGGVNGRAVEECVATGSSTTARASSRASGTNLKGDVGSGGQHEIGRLGVGQPLPRQACPSRRRRRRQPRCVRSCCSRCSNRWELSKSRRSRRPRS
jgi:hypothetical protein